MKKINKLKHHNNKEEIAPPLSAKMGLASTLGNPGSATIICLTLSGVQ